MSICEVCAEVHCHCDPDTVIEYYQKERDAARAELLQIKVDIKELLFWAEAKKDTASYAEHTVEAKEKLFKALVREHTKQKEAELAALRRVYVAAKARFEMWTRETYTELDEAIKSYEALSAPQAPPDHLVQEGIERAVRKVAPKPEPEAKATKEENRIPPSVIEWAKSLKPLDPEARMLLYNNLWSLYVEAPKAEGEKP